MTLSRVGVCVLALLALSASTSWGEERYALLISGASGSPEYAQQHQRWRESMRQVLVDRLHVAPTAVVVLGEKAEGTTLATRDNVRAAFADLKNRMKPVDLLLVVLFGHGTFDGVDAKFNLVGPDLDTAEWKALIGGVPGHVVFVNTTSASFPFLERLSGSNRIVITATDSEAQKYQTVFPEFFAKAFDDEAADLDKDGRVSLWEAFVYTAAAVKTWYEQRGQLSTERALLDDNGDGVGRHAGEVTKDGAVASRTFLDASADGTASTDPELADLIGQRNQLEGDLDELKRKRQFMPPGDYERELERIAVAISRVSRRIRTKS
ncbi:MAG: hypothetical protein U0Q12_26745 [Vicinamibacterales bacterium]